MFLNHPLNQIENNRIARLGFCFVTTLSIFSTTLHAYDNEIERKIDVNPSIQRAIENIEKASTPQEFDDKLSSLLDRAKQDRKLVLEQLLHFAAREDASPDDQILIAQVIKKMDIGMALVVATYVPHLDNEEPRVRALAREWLIQSEDRSAARQPYFGHYLPLIKAELTKGEEPQYSLVEHMYEADAGLAVLTMMRAYDLREPAAMKPILWAEHIVTDLLWQRRFGFVPRNHVETEVVTELGRLTQSNHWWARLYVANVIIAHPELADAQWANALTRDTHELVRDAAEAWKIKVRPTNQ